MPMSPNPHQATFNKALRDLTTGGRKARIFVHPIGKKYKTVKVSSITVDADVRSYTHNNCEPGM